VLQPFVLVKAFPRVKSQQGIYGSEVETTFGAEAEGHLPAGYFGDLGTGMSRRNGTKSLFAGRHFDREVILLCVRWYLRIS
jgi:hypothetical protein